MGVVREHTTEIDGLTYHCTTFTASEGLTLLPALIRLFGKRVIQLAMQSGDNLPHMLEQPEVLAAIVTEAAKEAAGDDEGWLVLRRLVSKTTCDQTQIGDAQVKASVAEHFDTHFTGRLMHLIKVSVWVATQSFAGP